MDPVGSSGTVSDAPPAHWGFWGTILWGALVGILFYLVQGGVFLGFIVARNPRLTEPDLPRLVAEATSNGTLLAYATFATTLICGALVIGIVKLKKRSNLRNYLALQRVTWATLLKWIGLMIGFAVLSDLITILVGRPLVPPFMLSAYATASPVWILWVALLVAAPLFEEPFFRGFLLKGFESSLLRPHGAVIVTALLWAVIHLQYDLIEIATIFLMGLLLGAARVRTGSIAVPLVMHSVANLIASVETALNVGPL